MMLAKKVFFNANSIGMKIIMALGIFAVYGVFLYTQGVNPFVTYNEMLQSTFGNIYGIGEVTIKATPFILTALATALPARVGLISVGGEGQLAIGALSSTFAAVFVLKDMPSIIGIPLLMLAGVLGGALWAVLPGILKVTVRMNETITTLLLNYVAFFLVGYFIYGLLKSPEAFGWPYSARFSDSLRLPTLEGTRIHIGILIAVAAAIIVWYVTTFTRLGFRMRVVGGNIKAAKHSGIFVGRTQFLTLIAGGAIGGLAGMIEVSGIEGHLRPMTGVGYGYIGFLVAWMAGNHPLWILPFAVLLGAISVGGNALEMHSGLNSSIVLILMGLILIVILAGGRRGRP